MKERPILFSAPMVRAILEGRKTQTRRLVKLRPGQEIEHGAVFSARDPFLMLSPYGSPGDRLWVRETFHGGGNGGAEVAFKADYLIARDVKRWTPAIHMPRRLSRITLEVTGVRVERLQDISEEDARAEGIDAVRVQTGPAALAGRPWATEFCALWDSLNAKRAPWASNPWVWVVEFRRAEAAP